MNAEPRPSSTAQNAAATGEAAASAYIAQELPKARKTLKRTRIVGLILVCLVGAYITMISVTMVRFFQPREAAQVASGMIVRHLDNDGPALAAEIEREVPLLIRQLPDYCLQELPRYRQEVEKGLERELRAYCASFSRDLGNQMDTLIDTHKAELKVLFENANDRAALRQILPNFDQLLTGFLKTDADGKQIQQRVTDLAAVLKEIEQRVERLANASDLTPEEQKARRSLAVLARAIKRNTEQAQVTPAPAQ